MPKYCSVPNCKNDSGSGKDRKSFYTFPLQDPLRLQQWLKNMGRENWIPSRHQYICHEHFTPSCFRVRWGIRYLERDAIPTLFQGAEKRKAAAESEMKAKRLRVNTNQSISKSGDGSIALETVDMQSATQTVHMYEITIEPSELSETSLVETSDGGELDSSRETESLTSVESIEAGISLPLTLLHSMDDLGNGEKNKEVLLLSDYPTSEGHDELMKKITTALLAQGHQLVITDSTLACTDETTTIGEAEDTTCSSELFSDVIQDQQTKVIAYFETIPNVLPTQTYTQFTYSPDTVLSSALSSKPIPSTLPITSKHTAPSPSPLLNAEKLDADEEEGKLEEEEEKEEQDYQLEEHCYHKNSLSKEQLEAIVAGLQRKVKVLQQRHRRHQEKLLGLENTVSQLRQSNLLNEERLQLLERAYIEANVADAGETVAIIYEEDDAAYFYTPPNEAEMKP
ncbi:THAP domain-containing protein 5-like isoform 1-T1 [Pholidichthys leucotaenia]